MHFFSIVACHIVELFSWILKTTRPVKASGSMFQMIFFSFKYMSTIYKQKTAAGLFVSLSRLFLLLSHACDFPADRGEKRFALP